MRLRSAICVLALALLAGCNEDNGGPIDTAAAERGRILAEGCRACHALDNREHRVGPSLLGIVGRQVASQKGYDYSEALKALDFIWDPKRLATFIQDPTGNIAGTKMAYGGITPAEAGDIVEFLRSIR